MSRPRLIGLGALVLLVFAVFSCEEKVMTDLKNAAKQSMLATEYPEEVKKVVDQVKTTNQSLNVRVYGLVDVADIEKFANDNGAVTFVSVPNDPDFTGYAILNDWKIKQMAEYVTEKRGDDDVYTIVEEMAKPVSGMTEFYEFIGQNMKYPVVAINANVEGRVFVNFMVDETGKLSDFKIVRGIGMGCDEEAVRVLKLSPDWIPAKQRGVPVKSSFNLAIIFKIDPTRSNAKGLAQSNTNVEPVTQKMLITMDQKSVNGKIVFTGRVVRHDDNSPMPGTVIFLKNRNEGTTTDLNGEFKLQSPIKTGSLMFSFVGFGTEERSF